MTKAELSLLLSYATDKYEEKTELLCKKYPSFFAISEASLEDISKTLNGDMKTSVYIKLAVAINSRKICNDLKNVSLKDEETISRYLVNVVGLCSVETVYLVSFDKSGRLIAVDRAGEGTVNASAVIPRRLLELAKHRRAHTVAVAHNHPNGEAVASFDDEEAIEALRSVFNDADIRFHGGYVVAAHGCVKI